MNVIPNYSDYRATADGRILSTKRSPPTVCKVTGHSENSPPRVQIRRDDKPSNHFVSVAILVASAYHGEQPEEVAVMHLDGDFANCDSSNLSWVDPSEPQEWLEGTAAIPGFPGYFAHESGAIFSTRRGRIVRQLRLIDTSGGSDVSVVMFDEAGKERLVRAGAAICAAFIGDLNGQVAYADGDRRNLSGTNLSWVPDSEDLGVLPDTAKPIPGFPGYFVGEDAVVYTTVALSTKKESVFRLTPSLNMRDYWSVTLRKDGKQRRTAVHVLVAMAFHGVKKDPALVARHLDDDRDNNHYTNIAWGTHQENMTDRDRNGSTARGPNLRDLSDDDIREIRRRCDAGEKSFVVGRDYRLRHAVISNIAARKTFTTVE